MTPERVVVQIKADQVAEGFYTLEGNLLTMTYGDGTPVDEFQFRHTLKAGENPKSIAAVLTKEVRKTLRSELVSGFSDDINYTKTGWA